MGGDQPDWTESGKIPTGAKRRGPESRAPDWHGDHQKKQAKEERDKRERGELVVAVGPFCVPCGKRFAKQTVYDAHLSGKKHLAALQRMGRDEEAMVCQLDVEANKRRLAEAEEAKAAQQRAAMGKASASASDAESDAAKAVRLAAREEKLRQRDMLPMPSCVTATSVYTEGNPEGEVAAGSSEGGAPSASTLHASATDPSVAAPVLDDAAAAAVGSGAQGFSYTGGTQDGASRPNRFTSAEMAAQHRKMAEPAMDWFNVRPPASE